MVPTSGRPVRLRSKVGTWQLWFAQRRHNRLTEMSTRAEKRSRFAAPWVIFWVAFGLRVAVILIGHTYKLRSEFDHFNFGFEAGRIARSLVLGQGYANPFNGPSGSTAWLPPIYPLIMAGAFKLFGIYTNAAAMAVLFVNSLFSAAIAPAVYEIAARCFDARGLARRGSVKAQPVALWSAWMWAVYPAALQYAIHWFWEMSVSTCLFAWVVVLALRLRGVGERGIKEQGSGIREQGLGIRGSDVGLWVGFGVLWGLIGLSNASLLILLAPMVVWVGWSQLRAWRVTWRTWAGVGFMSLMFCVVMAPWVIRNERVLHAFLPTRSNLGIELYASTLESHDALPWGTALPVWAGDPEFKLFVKMGEVKFAAMRNVQAKARIKANPKQFWKWVLDRFLYFWDGTPHVGDNKPAQEFGRQLSYSFLSLCGLLGLALMLKRRVEGAGLFAIVFLLLPLPYYLVTVQARFRHPMEPLIAVLAVYLFRSTESRP
jgi:hypothetical protein